MAEKGNNLGGSKKMKSEDENLNYDLYKDQTESYGKYLRQMIKAFIKKCPREMLIKILTEEKIIKKDWMANGNKYVEVKGK